MAGFAPLPSYSPPVLYGYIPRKQNMLAKVAGDAISAGAGEAISGLIDKWIVTEEEKAAMAKDEALTAYYGAMTGRENVATEEARWLLDQMKRQGQGEEVPFVPNINPTNQRPETSVSPEMHRQLDAIDTRHAKNFEEQAPSLGKAALEGVKESLPAKAIQYISKFLQSAPDMQPVVTPTPAEQAPLPEKEAALQKMFQAYYGD